MATEAEIVLKLRDEASKGLDAVVNQIKKLEAEAKKAAADIELHKKRMGDFKDTITGAANEMGGNFANKLGVAGQAMSALGPAGLAAAAAIGAMAAATFKGAEALFELAKRGSEVANLERSFSALAARAGQDFNAIIAAAKEGSKGLLSEFNIMQAANKGFLLGLPITAKEMQTLSKAAVALGQAMSVGPEQALKDLITGLGRGSAAILDNLGITIKAEDAYKQYAATLGKSASELTEAEKKIAIYNAAMEAAKDATETVGGVNVGLNESLQQVNASWSDLTDQLGLALAKTPGLGDGLGDLAEILSALSGFVKDNREEFSFWLGVMGDIFSMTTTVGNALDGLKDAMQAVTSVMPGESPVVKTPTAFGATAPGGIDFDKITKDAIKAAEEQVKAADKAAKASEAAAKRQAEAYAKAAEKARQEWDRFFLDMEKRGREASRGLQDDIDKAVAAAAKQNEARAMAIIDQKKKEAEAVKAISEHTDKANEELTKSFHTTLDWSDALADVAHQFQVMGGAGGFIANIAGGIAGIGSQIERLKKSVSEGGLAGAGGIGGFLGKLGAGMGIAGAAFSIGKAIFGGIKKLFGGGDDKKKAEEEAKKAEEAARKAAEEQKKRIEGLTKATAGLALMTSSFAKFMEKGGQATAETQAQFSRLGTFAVATFAGLVRETGDVIGALNQMGPSLDSLSQTMGEFGFTASGAFAHLLSLRQVVAANEDIANSISGLNQLMQGLGEAGLITKDVLLAMGSEATANFNALIAQGVSANDAMALMQPTLQELWERQKQLGVTYDDNTQKLLDQAEQQGLVGDNMRSVNEQILEVLLAIGEVLGAQLPAAMRRMGDEAETQFGRLADAARDAGGIAGHTGPFSPSDFESVPGFAAGGVVAARPPFGSLVRVGEREPEAILTASQLSALTGGSRTIVVQVGQRVLAKVVESSQERGDIAPKSRLRRAG